MSAPTRETRQAARRPVRSQAVGRGAGGRREAPADTRALLSKLPDPLPITPAEIDLVRVYFADLIAHVLKGPS